MCVSGARQPNIKIRSVSPQLGHVALSVSNNMQADIASSNNRTCSAPPQAAEDGLIDYVVIVSQLVIHERVVAVS